LSGLTEAKEAYPGWADLLDELKGFQFDWISVKEKYGALRIQLYGADTAAWDKAEELEGRSERVCENCGAPGEIFEESNWFFCRCKGCRENHLDGG